MELLQLKYFCETAKSENLSETAKKFYVPPSNISSSIKRLERELGCELFNHFSNKITLNEKGRLFYERISSALLLIDDAKTEISDNEDELRGEIHLRCKSNRGLVTAAMEKFIAKHPKVRFKMTFGEAHMKKIDLLVSYDVSMEYSERIFLLEEDLPIAMRRDNPLAKLDTVSVRDFKNEPFITGLSVQTSAACAEAGFYPNIAFETNDPAYARKYVEMGLGVAFIPSYSWRGLFSDNIVLKSVGVSRKTYAYVPANRYTKRSVREFIRVLLDEVNSANVSSENR